MLQSQCYTTGIPSAAWFSVLKVQGLPVIQVVWGSPCLGESVSGYLAAGTPATETTVTLCSIKTSRHQHDQAWSIPSASRRAMSAKHDVLLSQITSAILQRFSDSYLAPQGCLNGLCDQATRQTRGVGPLLINSYSADFCMQTLEAKGFFQLEIMIHVLVRSF